jgi:hypothetical protein
MTNRIIYRPFFSGGNPNRTFEPAGLLQNLTVLVI